MERLEGRLLLSTTYYVSPTGSDGNPGTSANSPWQTVAKVNSTSFAAGDQILFQRGAQWRESLVPGSSGTTAAPITFSAYGDLAQPKPTFVGSDPLNTAVFSLLAGTTSTYVMNTATVANAVYDNHQFLISATDHVSLNGGNNTNATTDLNYVKSTAGTWFYDTGSSKLYVNVGGSLSGHVLTAAHREDAVYSYQKSNLIFQNLNAVETAKYGGGYAFRVMLSTNVKILDCDASLAGKHHFGVIDSTGFVGQNLTASLAPPELGFGGASAFVMYSDDSRSGLLDTSQWINDTFVNPNGPYAAFISHGVGTDPIGSILIQNMSGSGYGVGIIVYSTGPKERAKILDCRLDGGTVEMDPDNSLLQNLTLTGAGSAVTLAGSHSFVQNCIFNGSAPNLDAGRNGVVVDSGQDNTIRFNTFHFTSSSGPAIGVMTANSNTHIYGNIFDDPQPIRVEVNNNDGVLDSNFNVFSTTPVFAHGDDYNPATVTYGAWTAMGRDQQSIIGDPKFTSAANGDFSIQGGSPAIDLYKQTPNQAVPIATDISGAARPMGNGYDAGAFEFQPPRTLALAGTSGNDQYYLRLISTSPATLGVWTNTNHQGSGTPTQTLAMAGISDISVAGLGGNDQLTLDFSAGSVAPAGGISFDGGAGSDTLAVVGTSGADSFTVNAAQVLFGAAACNFQNVEAFTVDPKAGADTISANVGATAVVYDTAGAAAGLTINANANLTFSYPSTGGIQPWIVGAMNIGAAGVVSITPAAAQPNRAVLVVSSLAISNGGRLDLNNNDLIVKNGDLAAITAELKSGFNIGANGYWNGSTGILSSRAAADATRLSTLAAMKNSSGGQPIYGAGTSYGLFDGQNASASDVLVKYTYYGDADLNGIIDGSDYAEMDNGFNNKLSGWSNGDFNYDGMIDGSDYSMLDNAFNSHGTSFAFANSTIATPAVDAAPAAAAASKAQVFHSLQTSPARPLAVSVFSSSATTVTSSLDDELMRGGRKHSPRYASHLPLI